ncbi:MAG TPA: M56 family metallopeptidase [Streptosporangiaceae bacterium]|nr:M56 family metallopeptidase [Streptosporangiaceae bacterium]
MRITAVALLLLFAVVVPAAAGRWLPGAAWPSRAPRAGVAAWLAGALSVVFSLMLAGLILAVPCLPAGADPAMLRACLALLQAQYTSPAWAAAGLAGGVLVMTVLGRVTWYYCSAAASARRCRARHDDVLAVIAQPGPAADVRIIDSSHPAVYCLPGRRRIVLTTGALDCLDDGQLEAVLAHERAHLSGRHHLVLRLAAALERAFPRVRFFAACAEQVAYLVEVAADDAAVRRTPRLTVAAALLTVAAAGVPAGALGAGGSAAARRIERLIDPPFRGSRARRAVACAGLAAVSVLAAIAVALAFSTILRCPGAPLSL